MRQPVTVTTLRVVLIWILCVVLIAAQALSGSRAVWSGMGPIEVRGKQAPSLKNPHFFAAGDTSSGRASAEMRRKGKKIVGTTLLASGLLLCSWGIASWEVSEYQCCPAKNTENVIKIVVGVVLVNAGLIYLLGAND